MSNVIYAALSRQQALMREMSIVANNVANASTTGFRRDEFIFSEYVSAIRGEPSLSQTAIGGRMIDPSRGEMIKTGAPLDIAIEGEGYFSVETPRGSRLTRAGSFAVNEEGNIVTAQGDRLSGEGGSAITIPTGASQIVVSIDGVISADGAPVGRIALVDAAPETLMREGDNLFRVEGETTPVENAAMRQGYVEGSNVRPVAELARLIEVQRAYEMSQQMIEEEADRARRAVETLGGGR
jgi:flagellar basal-body rod protein FlgF